MIPAAFDYFRPTSLEEAIGLLHQHGEEAKLLAGAHSLLPAMKLRLAQPRVIIDLARVPDLNFIRLEQEKIAIGAMTTHREIERSELLREKCPLLPEVAAHIGDVQVRNRGTLGGSLAHADPAADWPAAALALEAQIEAVGPNGSRQIPATEFFVDLFQTALLPGEIISRTNFPQTRRTVAYEKSFQRASGFAIVGVAVFLDKANGEARLGVTGVAAVPYRARAVEEALRGQNNSAFGAAAEKATDGIEPLRDIHASSEFRAHLAKVHTRRALERAWRA